MQRFHKLTSTGKVASPKSTDLGVKTYAMSRVCLQVLADFGETFASGFAMFVKPGLQTPAGFPNIETTTRTSDFVNYSIY
jgi:hypothetical protein